MRRYLPAAAALSFLLATSAEAQTTKPLLSTRPKEQKAVEEEVLHIAPRPSVKIKSTIVERTSGQRLIIKTDDAGTKVTEQGSGRTIWSSNRDSHELKVSEYIAGGMGRVVIPGQTKPAE